MSFDSANNIGGFIRKDIAHVYPGSTQELLGIYDDIYASTGRPIYTASSGMNWGLGSFLPTCESATVINCSKMKKIHEVNLDVGIAHIDAGVSQGDLSLALKNCPFMLNVTSSSAHTSVVGNAMERGLGYYRQRSGDILGLKFLGGAPGRIFVTGGEWRREKDLEKAFVNKHGVGPSVIGAFLQSNFGIVAEAAVSLLPRPEEVAVVKASFHEDHICDVMKALRGLYMQDVIKGVSRVYNANAYSSVKNNCIESDFYTAYAIVSGARAACCAAKDEVLSRLKEFSDVSCIDAIADAQGEMEEAFFACAQGDPSLNDNMIMNTFGALGKNLDADSQTGWLTSTIFVPLNNKSLTETRKAFKVAREIYPRFKTTYNVIDHRSIDLVTSIYFDRESQNERDAAHLLLKKLPKIFQGYGYRPYRTDIDNPLVSSEDPYILDCIRNAFDPSDRFGKGRYVW